MFLVRYKGWGIFRNTFEFYPSWLKCLPSPDPPPHIHSNTHLTSTAIDNICCFLVTYGPVMSLTTKRIHLYIMNNSIFFVRSTR